MLDLIKAEIKTGQVREIVEAFDMGNEIII